MPGVGSMAPTDSSGRRAGGRGGQVTRQLASYTGVLSAKLCVAHLAHPLRLSLIQDGLQKSDRDQIWQTETTPSGAHAGGSSSTGITGSRQAAQ